MPSDNVRVRFAPSPTGHLHVGGARTALFNYLFARRRGGAFVLRVEDTDAARSSDEFLDSILAALRWLGLCWDEGPEVGGRHGPYRQSERREIYDRYIKELLAKGAAYECFCTPEELDVRKEKMRAAGLAPRYDGRCAALSPRARDEMRAAGLKPCLRLRMPRDADLSFDDVIRGRVEIKPEDLDDFVIARPDGSPTYNFVCVVDDTTMAITHVIRGEDHISNTPRQLAVYRALGLTPPAFAHLPLLLGPDKSRLSKRHGAKAAVEYRDEGFLPEALVNFLALLGWSYDDEREIFALDELVEHFALERVAKKGAVFDVEKLKWMNGVYIRGLPPAELFARARPWFKAAGLVGDADDDRATLAAAALALEQEKMKTLAEAPGLVDFFLRDDFAYDEKAARNLAQLPGGAATLSDVGRLFRAAEPFTAEELEAGVRGLAAGLGVAAGKLIHAIRTALSGRAAGPSLFHMAELLGRERAAARLARAADFLAESGAATS